MRDVSKTPSLATLIGGASAPIRFSLDGVPERERASVFREFFGREILKYDLERLPDLPFHVDVELQAMPGLLMMSGRSHGSCNRRTRETLAADPTDDIGMIINLAGRHRIVHGGRELVLDDGEAALVSLQDACSFTHLPPGDVLALRVPRKPFAPLVTRVDDCCFRRIPQHTPALRLLIDYVKMVQGGTGAATADLRHLVVNHVYDLMALAAGATREAEALAGGRGVRAAKLHAIELDIGRSLDQPDLSVAALARRHGCTPRYVQRLFESDGTTFTAYVLAQRLARAHRMLTDPRREGDKISAVAWDCGFGDVSYFNRAFRRRYGAAPSDVRSEARSAVHGPHRAGRAQRDIRRSLRSAG